MTVYKVLHYPHVLLKKKATPVIHFTDELREFAKNLIASMFAFEGGGLAATQVGVLKRIFVVDFERVFSGQSARKTSFQKEENDFLLFDEKGGALQPKFPMVLINPKILSTEKPLSINWEGCLSFPNAEPSQTDRYGEIEVEAQNEFGKTFRVRTTHLYASVCFQHEIDHLDGIVIADRWGQEREKKETALLDIREFENDPSERKKLKKLKPIEAHKIKFDFL